MTIRLLVAVDGSAHALRATGHAMHLQTLLPDLELHLINVQPPVESGHVRLFVAQDELEGYYRDQGLAALHDACAMLDQAAIPYQRHIAVGHAADVIARYAGELGFEQIIVGSHGRSGLSQLLLGSVASELIAQAPVPVTVVK